MQSLNFVIQATKNRLDARFIQAKNTMGCSAHFSHSGSCFYLFIYFFKSKSTSSMTSQHLQDVELQEKGEEMMKTIMEN